jgi:hypothetical protein
VALIKKCQSLILLNEELHQLNLSLFLLSYNRFELTRFIYMSIYAIKQYHRELEDLKHYGGTSKETAIRFAFQKLLDEYGRPFNLRLVPEVSIKLKNGKIVTPDGTLKDQLRLDHGYWESKDESDDINEEIRNKFSKGYPSDNILFEDSQTAVLFQQLD